MEASGCGVLPSSVYQIAAPGAVVASVTARLPVKMPEGGEAVTGATGGERMFGAPGVGCVIGCGAPPPTKPKEMSGSWGG